MTRVLHPTSLTDAESIPAARSIAALAGPALVASAVLALGQATSTNFGQFHPQAMPWLAMALLCTVAAAVRLRKSARAEAHRLETALWLAAIALQSAILLARDSVVPAAATAATEWSIRLALVAVTASAMAGLVLPTRFRAFCLIGMLAAHFVAGILVLRGHPTPRVDVIVFQRDACDALLAGKSPYAMTFPDISPAGSDFYGAGMSVNGRLQFGFPYPPLSVLLILPFHLLGDFRFAGLAATTVAAALIGLMSRSRRALAAAAMLLLTPMGFFVLWAGWTEPLAVMLLAATIYFSIRQAPNQESAAEPTCIGWKAILALGMLIAVKQYLVLLLPLIVLLVGPGRRMRAMAVVLLIAAAITLPLALWDPAGFIHSAVTLQFHQPYRGDALSFLSPFHASLPLAMAATTPFALVGLTMLATVRQLRPSPAAFTLAAALCLLVFFAFNKQAFCNYYHLVVGALCIAAALGDVSVASLRQKSMPESASAPT